jgi:FAD binding domain
MGVDPGVLTATLEQYNVSARAGRDEAFGRSADTLVPLDLGRLYAIQTWPGIAGTTGGPRHDERARVLRPDGRPIPGLYAAGAVSLVRPVRRVAVVTGEAGAIGGSVAAALIAADHQVVIMDRTGDVPVDLGDEGQVRAAA